MIYSKEIVREWLDEVAERAKDHPEWVDVFERCYTDTLDNTVEILEDGSTFVLTGDIPAMWLRDSTAQLRPYLHVDVYKRQGYGLCGWLASSYHVYSF